jgi:hypothetical protein
MVAATLSSLPDTIGADNATSWGGLTAASLPAGASAGLPVRLEALRRGVARRRWALRMASLVRPEALRRGVARRWWAWRLASPVRLEAHGPVPCRSEPRVLPWSSLARRRCERILMSPRGGVNRRICTLIKIQPTVSTETGQTGFPNRSDRCYTDRTGKM